MSRNELRAKLRFRKAVRENLGETTLSLLSVWRYEKGDIYFFEGKKLTKEAIKNILFWRKQKEEQEKRLNQILEDDSKEDFLRKLKTIKREVSEFINFLENN